MKIDYEERSDTFESEGVNGGGYKALLKDFESHMLRSKSLNSEQKRLTQIMNAQEHAKKIINIKDQTGNKLEFHKQENSSPKVLYFQNCFRCKYKIFTSTIKIMVEGCSNCVFEINSPLFTSLLEIWHTKDSTFLICTEIRTIQMDMSSRIKLFFSNQRYFERIVWAQIDESLLRIMDPEENAPSESQCNDIISHGGIPPRGYCEAKMIGLGDLIKEQYITHHVGVELITEMIIRDKSSGFPTTQREKKLHEKMDQEIHKAVKEYMKNIVDSELDKSNKKKCQH